jgi:hypothetical protein
LTVDRLRLLVEREELPRERRAVIDEGTHLCLLGTLLLRYMHQPTRSTGCASSSRRGRAASLRSPSHWTPTSLDAYANADITAAERYLKALKKQLSQGPAA